MLAATEKKYKLDKNTKYDGDINRAADHALREQDRVLRWKKVHDLLRKQNKKARKEQDETAKDCEYFRQNGLVKKDKTAKLGLRWGVAMPPMTWNAIIQADIIATGKSELQHPDKEATQDIKGSNQLVKDLEKAFPKYRVS